MDDLFKQFRENLEGRPEPAFDQRDWQHLATQLGPKPEKRRGVLLWWFAAPLLLASLTSNWWLFQSRQAVVQKLQAHAIQRDTIYLTTVVQHTDTVLVTRILQQTVVEYLPATFARNSPDKPLNTSLQESFSPENQANAVSENLPEKKQLPTRLSIDSFQIIPLRWEELTPPGALQQPEMVEFTPLKRRKTIQQQLYSMRPKDFQLSVNSGLLYPLAKDFERKSAYNLSLEGSVAVSPNLRMWAEVSWLKLRFLSERMGDDAGIPVVQAPADDFEFVQAETNQPQFQYAIGMQYMFNAKKRWQPSLGLGYAALSSLPYEVTYEFRDKNLGTELAFDQTVNKRAWLTDFLVLRSGVAFRVSSRVQAQLGASYRAGFRARDIASPPMFGLQGGLKFGF